MLGNCAIGRLRIVMAPTITKTMEMTIATIGRLIKNFDIGSPSLAFPGKRLRVHLHARTHLLHAFGNHTVASFQSVCDNPLGAALVAYLNGGDASFVLPVDRRAWIPALKLRDCALRYKQRILLDSDDRANFAVPARAQNVSRIGE